MSAVSHLIDQYRQDLQLPYVRGLAWITGTADWCYESVLAYLTQHPSVRSMVVSEHDWDRLSVCSIRGAKALLGQEFDILVYDGFSGINPDALGQVSGLIKGGGVCIFISSPADADAFFDDPQKEHLKVLPFALSAVGNYFLEHLKRCLLASSHILWIDQNKGCLSLPKPSHARASLQSALLAQQTVVDQISASCLSQVYSAAVLLAPRGRGKSTALGKVAAKLNEAGLSVQVTAPTKLAVHSLFEQAGDTPNFALPADVPLHKDCADVLIIDEAAGISVNLLEAFALHYRHVIYATTTEGYEGTGRGFGLRFMARLADLRPELDRHDLEKPIRWSDGDPLESLLNQILLLKHTPIPYAFMGKTHYREISPQELIDYPEKLSALFGLLVDAHYRTTPGDLRILLDSPNTTIWLAENNQQIVGALLVAIEGELDEALIEQIWQGRRRPRGHLIPQLLVAQEGHRSAGALRCLRVVRIAVVDEYRRQGVAMALIDHAETWAREKGVELMGAAFAAAAPLLSFWQANGYQVVRIGTQLDPVSGSYALLVLKGISRVGQESVEEWRQQFLHDYPYIRKGWLRKISPSVETLLFNQALTTVPDHLSEDRLWQNLYGFAFHHRPYESTAPAFARLVEAHPELYEKVSSQVSRSLIETRVIQQQPEGTVMVNHGFANQKMLIAELRKAAQQFYAEVEKAGCKISGQRS